VLTMRGERKRQPLRRGSISKEKNGTRAPFTKREGSRGAISILCAAQPEEDRETNGLLVGFENTRTEARKLPKSSKKKGYLAPYNKRCEISRAKGEIAQG